MKKILIASTVALGLSATSTFAITAQSGFFLTGGAGIGQLATPSKDFGNLNHSSKNYGFAWQAGLGIEQALNPNFSIGLEVDYIQPGQSSLDIDNGVDSESIGIRQRGWQAIANATYFWNNGFNVFAKAGVASLTQSFPKLQYNGKILDTSNLSLTKNKFTAGLGMGYDFSQNFGMNVTWMHTFGTNYSSFQKASQEGEGLDSRIVTNNSIMLNLVFTFPTHA